MRYITLPTTRPRSLCTSLFPNRQIKVCSKSGCVRRIARKNFVYIASTNKHPKKIPLSVPKDISVVCARRKFVQEQGVVDHSRKDCVYILQVSTNSPQIIWTSLFPNEHNLKLRQKKVCAGSGYRILMVGDINRAQGLCIYCKSQQPAQ